MNIANILDKLDGFMGLDCNLILRISSRCCLFGFSAFKVWHSLMVERDVILC